MIFCFSLQAGWAANGHGHLLTKPAHHAKAVNVKKTVKRKKIVKRKNLVKTTQHKHPAKRRYVAIKHPARQESMDHGMAHFTVGTNVLSDRLTENAFSFLGTPYRPGGSSQRGFDCSGLVYYVFNQLGVQLPRTSYEQANEGIKVAKSALKKGDLVFFRTTRRKNERISHVGIYLGHQQFIHSPATGGAVRIDRLSDPYWQRTFVTAKRVLDLNS